MTFYFDKTSPKDNMLIYPLYVVNENTGSTGLILSVRADDTSDVLSIEDLQA